MVSEVLELTRQFNSLFAEKRRIVEGQIAGLDDILGLKGRLYDANEEVKKFFGLMESFTTADKDNLDALLEEGATIFDGLKNRIGVENLQSIVETIEKKFSLEIELSKLPKVVSEDTSYCPVDWGDAYKKTQEYGKSIGIDIPSGYVFVPIEDAQHSGFVFLNNDPEVYLRPDAPSKTVSHELFHKVHKNKPEMPKTERKIYQEGLADWFKFKVHGEDGNPEIEDFLDYVNNDIYRENLMDVLERQAPYRLGLILFNDIESQYGTEKVVEIANKYKGPGLKPLLDLMKPETRKIFDNAFSVVYDKPIRDIPQSTTS